MNVRQRLVNFWERNTVSGSIGKLGETYTVDSKLVSVSTGATKEQNQSLLKGL